MNKAWLAFGAVGGALALFSAFTWVAGLVGGLFVLTSVALQYFDSRPFRREITAADWAATTNGYEFIETAWRAKGRDNISIYERDGERWVEVMTDNGIGANDRFFVGVAVPVDLLVIAR